MTIDLTDFDLRPNGVVRDELVRKRELAELSLLPFFWRPTVRILVVTDGSGSFDDFAGFGLGRALAEVQADPWWWVRFEVTTAHRGGFGGADHQNWNFASPRAGIALDDFDEIWLFGVVSSGDISSAEVNAIRAFMDGGGGVFATGDHESLGAAICANLPRVNRMRQWRPGGPAGAPPPQSGPSRHDTNRAGANGVYEFDDQSDDVAQVVRPTRYYDPWGFNVIRRKWRPHPLLCGKDGVLDHLPDHMHEGRCVAPTQAEVDADPAQWPGGVAPEIVARATVIPHVDVASGPVNGTTFGVVSAYDGHRADVGRISCDATWHHWFNINLEGFDTTSAHYDEIRRYFWNTALWLAPKAKQRAMFRAATFGIVWLPPLNEVHALTIPLWQLGFVGIDAIGRRAPQCAVTSWLIAEVPFLEPLLQRRPFPPDPDPTFEGLELLREHLFGAILAEALTSVDRSVPKEGPSEREMDAVVTRGVRRGLSELAAFERKGLARAEEALAMVDRALEKVDGAEPALAD